MGIKNIKTKIKKNRFLKPIYNQYHKIKLYQHESRKKEGMQVFDEKNIEVMRIVQNAIENYQTRLSFFFSFGTLLGVIREGKLLSRDMDLDLSVFIEDDKEIDSFRKYLADNGFKLLHSFYINGIGLNQDSFECQGVMVDINYSKKQKDNMYYNYLFYDTIEQSNQILIFPFSDTGIKKIEFNGLTINVPGKPELYLKETYGEDWRVPNPNYKYWENPQAIKTDLVGKVEVKEKFRYS